MFDWLAQRGHVRHSCSTISRGTPVRLSVLATGTSPSDAPGGSCICVHGLRQRRQGEVGRGGGGGTGRGSPPQGPDGSQTPAALMCDDADAGLLPLHRLQGHSGKAPIAWVNLEKSDAGSHQTQISSRVGPKGCTLQCHAIQPHLHGCNVFFCRCPLSAADCGKDTWQAGRWAAALSCW